jgi:hypothetical protein
MWWRSEFDAAPFPYLLPNARAPKVKSLTYTPVHP